MEPVKPEPLGRSLKLEDGDLVLAAGDLVMVAGRDNLMQGLRVAIETPLASDVFNVAYGFDVVGTLVEPGGIGRLDEPLRRGLAELSRPEVKELLRTNLRDLVRLNVVRTLSRDDRVREVQEVVVGRTDRAARRWTASVVLSTVAEGELSLQLDGPGV
jgi:hypothetical protein